MKKMLLAGIAIMLFISCGNSKKDGNPYLGRLPELEVEENEAYEKFQQSDAKTSWYYSEEKEEYELKRAAEFKALQGVRMPCVSGQPDLFSVVGDVAVFKGESYHMLLQFNRGVRIPFDTPFTVIFTNSEDNQTYGSELQYMYSRMYLEDGWHHVKVSSHYPGDCRLQSFYINSINYDDATALQNRTDQAVIVFKTDDIWPLEGNTPRDYYFPENMAVEIQDAFFNAIVNDDMEAYDGVDYGFGEMDCFEDENDAKYFNEAYDLWKSIFPEKWKVIKDFRAKKIKEGYALCTVDMDDPE